MLGASRDSSEREKERESVRSRDANQFESSLQLWADSTGQERREREREWSAEPDSQPVSRAVVALIQAVFRRKSISGENEHSREKSNVARIF
jgi:hypothetical protein